MVQECVVFLTRNGAELCRVFRAKWMRPQRGPFVSGRIFFLACKVMAEASPDTNYYGANR